MWGIPYLLIRVAVRELSPAALVCLRTGLGALLLLPLSVRGGGLRAVVSRWRWLVAYTVVEVAVPWLLLSDAERRLSSSLTGLVVAAVPLVGVGIARLGGDTERLDAARLTGLLLGLAGVAALLGLDIGALEARAVAEMAVVVVGYALGPVLYQRHLADLPPRAVVVWSLGLTALAYLPFLVVERPRHVAGETIASVLLLATACTALAFLLFFELIATIGPARATVVTYVNPAVAVLLGVLMLGEPFTVGLAVGFPLILGGSVLAARRRHTAGDAAGVPPASVVGS